MMSAIREILNFHEHLWTQPGILLIYTLALIAIVYRGVRGSGKDRMLSVFIAAAGIVAYCPVTMMILVPRLVPSISEYTRLGWLLFPIPVIAYGVVSFFNNRGDRTGGDRFIPVTVVVILYLFLNGNIAVHEGFFKLPENIYKLPREAVVISDAITEDAVRIGLYGGPEGGDSSVQEGERTGIRVVIHGFTNDFKYENSNEYAKIYYGIRQYAPQLRLGSMVVDRATIAATPEVLPASVPDEAEYAVIIRDTATADAMEIGNEFEEIIGTEGFLVYRRTGY